MDVRPGGVWRFIMHGPDGRDYQNHVVYREIVRPERLAYSHTGEGVDFESTITFAVEQGTKTKLTLRMVFATTAERDRVEKEFGAIEGGKQITQVKQPDTPRQRRELLGHPQHSERLDFT